MAHAKQRLSVLDALVDASVRACIPEKKGRLAGGIASGARPAKPDLPGVEAARK